MVSRRQAIGGGLGLAFAVVGCDRFAGEAPEVETRTETRVDLAVPHLQQEKLLCVPTSAAMVLAYYGDPRSPRELKTLAAGRDWDAAAPFDDFSITLYRDLLNGLNRIGYGWAQRRFAPTPGGLDDGLATIVAALAAGRPVLVDVSLPSGHTFVVRGFDSVRRSLDIVDPDQPAPGRYTVSYDEFASVWNESAYGDPHRYLLLTSPKQA